MKKHLIAVLLVVVMFLAVLSGCSLIKGLEHDVQVILINDGNYVGTYTVNQFNNAIVPEVEKPVGEGDDPQYYQDGTPMYDEDGNAINYTFVGWAVKENWTEEDGEEYLSENTGLIRYDDIKDFVGDESLSITLYAAYSVVSPRDLVIAWYDKETTSGLNQTYMDAFEENLYSYLETQGYDTASMDIVIRGYSGGVGTTCSQIIKDGDVDIMVGWSSTSNITSTGGMVEGVDFIENNSGITIGSKSRYAARLTDTELCNLVYHWIFDEYGESLDEDPPVVEPSGDADLVIAWYNRHTSSTESGLTEEIVAQFGEALEAYLATQGYTDIEVVYNAYDGNVETSIGNMISDGGADILIGWASNIGSYVTFIENVEGISIGTAERYAARLTDTEICNVAFDWIVSTYGSVVEEPEEPETPEEPDEPVSPVLDDNVIVIGWWSYSTSGLTEDIINNVAAALVSDLNSQGYTVELVDEAPTEVVESTLYIIVRAYDEEKVADMGSAIKTDGDVDLYLGAGANLQSTGGVVYVNRQSDIAMGTEDNSRYIYQLTDSEICAYMFNWLISEEAVPLYIGTAASTTVALAA